MFLVGLLITIVVIGVILFIASKLIVFEKILEVVTENLPSWVRVSVYLIYLICVFGLLIFITLKGAT